MSSAMHLFISIMIGYYDLKYLPKLRINYFAEKILLIKFIIRNILVKIELIGYCLE